MWLRVANPRFRHAEDEEKAWYDFLVTSAASFRCFMTLLFSVFWFVVILFLSLWIGWSFEETKDFSSNKNLRRVEIEKEKKNRRYFFEFPGQVFVIYTWQC